MGLAASQARYLALTSRKSDLEYQSQTINTRRIQLSYKTAEIAEAYADGMNNQRIKISHTEKDGSYSSTVWDELTFTNLIDNKSGSEFMLIGTNGTALQPSPYTMETTVDGKQYTPVASTGVTAKTSAEITIKDVNSGAYIPSDVSTTAWTSSSSSASTSTTSSTDKTSAAKDSDDKPAVRYVFDKESNSYVKTDISSDSEKTSATKAGTSTSTTSSTSAAPTDSWRYAEKDGKYYLVNTWKLNPNLTEKQYAEIQNYDKANNTSYAGLFKQTDNVARNYKLNSQYEKDGGLDIQTLLTSGKAQIVTKDFYNYLVNNWGYNFASGMTTDQFNLAQQNWTNQTDGLNPSKKESVVEWEADQNSVFQQRSYTEDDAYVLAKYESETAKIQAQDKILETQEKNIETQHKAIETELDGLKKVIENNIDKSFKMFS